MFKFLFFLFHIIAFVFNTVKVSSFRNNTEQTEITIRTSLGFIRGTDLHTWKGSIFYGFRGIRYGKPPVNELRFKDPVPIESWNETFDATSDGPMCPQPDKNEMEYSEDCLRLNIYIRKLPNCEMTSINDECSFTKKPVLFYIPGGGYYVGSGISSDYGGPYYLMEHDIILVTINYRLGFFGYLNLGTKYYPGNAGFKDQVLALRFIRDHIEAFGGDPNRITLIGNSAGAFSIALHLISPMSRGLFHQAILGSGGLDVKSSLPSHQINAARKQAKLFNCNTHDIDLMIQCFKSKTTKEYVDTVYDTFTFGKSLWGPVVEQNFNHERFLIEQPHDSLIKGNFIKIPLIVGVTEDELVESAVGILKSPISSFALDHTWNIILPKLLGYEAFTHKSFNISKTLRQFYNIPTPIRASNSIDQLSQLISDGVIGFGSYRVLKFMEKFKPVYQYKFSYVGRYSHLYYPEDKAYGSEHSDDFIYILCRNRTAPIFNVNDPEAVIIEYITKLYSNFVIYGDPNDETDPVINYINWTPLNDQSRNYLNMNENLTIDNNLFKDRYDLWDELFPIQYP
uniref:Carboxylic ester hydrolase n=1 Tax=Culicoides sonorensis TaxID=179676 RepID=A0A336LPH6_CULSO